MATETKIALLIGLAFIVAFAFVLARQDEGAGQRQDQQVAPPPQVVAGNDAAHADSDRVWQRRTGGDRLVQMIQGQPAAQGQPDERPDGAGSDEIADDEPHAVPIIGVEGQPPAVLPGPPPGPMPPTTPTQWYTVQPGDNLTRIARKFYGQANGAKWRLILEANPTRIPSPEGLRPRVRIIIPPLPGQTPALPPYGVVPTILVAPPTPTPVSPLMPTAVAVRTYEVKVGDTLSSIASRHLGSAGQYHKILEWNRDLIRDANSIRPGMKLKLGLAIQTPDAVARTRIIVGDGSARSLELAGIGNAAVRARLLRLKPVFQRISRTITSLLPEQREQLVRSLEWKLTTARKDLRSILTRLGASDAEADECIALCDYIGMPWADLAAAERPNMTRKQREQATVRVLAGAMPDILRRVGAGPQLRRVVYMTIVAAGQPVFVDASVAPLETVSTGGASGGTYTPIPQQDDPPVAPPVAAVRTYLVQPGDTLSGIASAKLGSASKWRDLLRWNRRVLTGPQQLRPGMRLRLTAPARPVPAPVGVGGPVRAATTSEDVGGIVG